MFKTTKMLNFNYDKIIFFVKIIEIFQYINFLFIIQNDE